jgi:ADP-heptose:LPS heptosyltransferase
MTQQRAILAIKLDGIGDFSMALPGLRALMDSRPGCQIDVVVSSFNLGWRQVVPWIRNFYVIDFRGYRTYEPRRMGKARLVLQLLILSARLRCNGYDAAVDLRTMVGDWRGKLLCWLSGAPLRVGGPGTGGWALTRVSQESAVHQSDIMVERLRVLEPNLGKVESGLVSVSRVRPKAPLPHVVLHPGVGGVTRRWTMPYWIALARSLAQASESMTFQFMGGQEDAPALAEISAAANLQPAQIRISTTLREMLQVIADADILVGLNSSAPHLAYLVGTPAITIFSAANDPNVWSARGDNTVLFTPIECSVCQLFECKWQTHRCMEAILPETVFSAIEKKLQALGYSSQARG